MIDETLFEAEEKMDKAVEVAKEDFSTIRTGRANAAMFSKVFVDYYGSPTPLQQLASFNVTEARTILVSPFDKSSTTAIEKALRDSDLGVNPTNDGNVIRIVLPALTQERRKDFVKLARTKAEDARISVRNVRRRAKEELDRIVKDGEAGEDEVGSCGEGARVPDEEARGSHRPPALVQGERAPRGLMSQTAIAATRTPRPGRDLPVAIVVGVAMLVAVVASLFIRKEAFAVVAVLAVCAGLWELAQAFTRRNIHLPLLPLLVGAIGILVSAYTAGPEALFVAFMLTVGGVVVWRVLDGSGQPALRDATAGAFAAAYLPFLGGFVMLMLAEPDGPSRVMLFILLCVASDVGGYTVGVLLGRHPLAPSVSPKKTWEGLAGSIVLACVVGVVGIQVAFDGEPLVGVFLGLATVVTATLGDLAESMLKRDLELKDMGRLVPGHGGLLDRLDSLVLTAPAVYVVLTVLQPA